MKSISLISVLGLALVFYSCQEVVNVDLEDGPERLVVEGMIGKLKDSDSGHQRIRLSTTAPYFANDEAPPAGGANVRILDEEENVYVFAESDQYPGLYETNELYAELYHEYTLEIEFRGDTYRAREMLTPVAEIDTIYQYFVEESLFDEEGIRVRIDFTDPGDEENYYLWQQFRDGDTFIDPNPGTKWSLIASDEFYNGTRVFGREPNEEMIYEPGQTALVRQMSISKQAYDYLFLLFDQSGSGGPFSTPPVTIRGNVQNKTTPERYALGYFLAGEIDEAELTIR
jgi:hypothetical protein